MKKPTKQRFVSASALALALTVICQVGTWGATNGMILISTRKSQDLFFNTTDALDQKGPGQASQGDVAMAALLGDNGYSSRIVLDASLNVNLGGDPTPYLTPNDPNFNAILVILSGSSGSSDVPAISTNGVSVMIGEHSCIGDRPVACSCYMYSNGTSSGNLVNPGAGQYMVVVATNHPIMQGIPLDAQGRVKIFRDPYPEENLHLPGTGTGNPGKPNYEYSWTIIDATNAAPGTVVIGLLDSNTNKAVFAVNDIGGLLAFNPNLGYADTNTVRLVHWFVNEDGSGGSRRMFNALTEVGRLIFVRAAKWAMGETLEPVQTFKIIDVTSVNSGIIQVSWEGSAKKTYRLLASNDLTSPNWRTVVEDIPGADGIVTRKFDVSAAPQTLFMQIRALP